MPRNVGGPRRVLWENRAPALATGSKLPDMKLTSARTGSKGTSWRRELSPVLAVAALAADYLSPSAPWTILLPLGGVILLVAMRRWLLAAGVFALCSWVLVPTAARTVFAVEEMRGEHNAFWIDGVPLQSLDVPVANPCVPNHMGFTTLPIGPGHLINPRWALRDAIVSFSDLHNQLVIERWQDDATDCNF
jgi:hypothetical protein